jgi:solute carrier family 39 (zinc transporter), member 7
MVAFAVGGLMGDVLFHLLPEIFVGEDSHESARFVLVEPNRNLLLGVAVLVGFVTFVAMDKGLRIATGGVGGHDHSHGAHAHHDSPGSAAAATTSALEGVDKKGARARNGKGGAKKSDANGHAVHKPAPSEVNPSVKLGGYLNLMCVISSGQCPCPRREGV